MTMVTGLSIRNTRAGRWPKRFDFDYNISAFSSLLVNGDYYIVIKNENTLQL